MNDPEATPTGLQPISDEVDLALREVASRLTEIADSLRVGQARLGGMRGPERTAFVRNAAARLRGVEKYACFAATLFEEEFVVPLTARYDTPITLPAVRPQPSRFGKVIKLLGAIATLAGGLAALWRAITGRASGP